MKSSSGILEKKRQRAKELFPYARIDPYEDWTPQFPDGSGWNTTFREFPYFYEHISFREVRQLEGLKWQWQKNNNFVLDPTKLYKVIAIMVDPDFGSKPDEPRETYHNHKNTYFVKGDYLEHFLAGFAIDNYYDEQVVMIEQVDSIPSMEEKLK